LTVSDLLTQDDLNAILANLDEAKPDITHAIVIFETEDKTRHFYFTEMPISHAMGLLELTKQDLYQEHYDEEEDAES
jgi:hypothetical protein